MYRPSILPPSSLWNKEERHYEPTFLNKEQQILIGNQPHDFEVNSFEISSTPDHAPTKERIFTRCALQLNAPHDFTFHGHLGFSETSAQIGPSFYQILFENLKQKGFKNPQVIFSDNLGKGTVGYMENKEKISATRLRDRIEDARQIIQHLLRENLIEGQVCNMGHSLGAMEAIASTPFIKEAGHQTQLLQMMPATDEIGGALRPGFLWAVKNYVLQALKQAIAGRGCIQLTLKDHANMMFEGSMEQAKPHWEKAVPGSARQFLDFTLLTTLLRPSFNKALKAINGTVDIKIIQASNDQLLPAGMPVNLNYRLKSRDHNSKLITADLPHAISTTLSKKEIEIYQNLMAQVIT